MEPETRHTNSQKERLTNMDIDSFILEKMESKLIELMGRDAYVEFCAQIAREGLRKEIEGMEDGEFKDSLIDNIDETTR